MLGVRHIWWTAHLFLSILAFHQSSIPLRHPFVNSINVINPSSLKMSSKTKLNFQDCDFNVIKIMIIIFIYIKCYLFVCILLKFWNMLNHLKHKTICIIKLFQQKGWNYSIKILKTYELNGIHWRQWADNNLTLW